MTERQLSATHPNCTAFHLTSKAADLFRVSKSEMSQAPTLLRFLADSSKWPIMSARLVILLLSVTKQRMHFGYLKWSTRSVSKKFEFSFVLHMVFWCPTFALWRILLFRCTWKHSPSGTCSVYAGLGTALRK